jgi:hypothetical protein
MVDASGITPVRNPIAVLWVEQPIRPWGDRLQLLRSRHAGELLRLMLLERGTLDHEVHAAS